MKASLAFLLASSAWDIAASFPAPTPPSASDLCRPYLDLAAGGSQHVARFAEPIPGTKKLECQKSLSCSFSEIGSLTMSSRLKYLRHMESKFFHRVNARDQFRNIEGVISFFDKFNLGAPESWISYVDAAILESIQRGGAIALGLSSETGGNPGSELWASFLRGMRDGTLDDRSAHDFAWATAEQGATDYGVEKADAKFQRTTQENNWFGSTEGYRQGMLNRPPGPPTTLEGQISDWVSDTTNDKPAQCLNPPVWCFAGLPNGEEILSDPSPDGLLSQQVVACYLKYNSP